MIICTVMFVAVYVAETTDGVCTYSPLGHFTKISLLLGHFTSCHILTLYRKLSAHDQWSQLAVHVAMDMVVVIQDLSESVNHVHVYAKIPT